MNYNMNAHIISKTHFKGHETVRYDSDIDSKMSAYEDAFAEYVKERILVDVTKLPLFTSQHPVKCEIEQSTLKHNIKKGSVTVFDPVTHDVFVGPFDVHNAVISWELGFGDDVSPIDLTYKKGVKSDTLRYVGYRLSEKFNSYVWQQYPFAVMSVLHSCILALELDICKNIFYMDNFSKLCEIRDKAAKDRNALTMSDWKFVADRVHIHKNCDDFDPISSSCQKYESILLEYNQFKIYGEMCLKGILSDKHNGFMLHNL